MGNAGATTDQNMSGGSGLLYANGTSDYFEISALQIGGGALSSVGDDTWNFWSIELVEAIT
tara:strand:- start:65 stop:247 length:183 start_codon:yes stop_codon:yes gene_type:complete